MFNRREFLKLSSVGAMTASLVPGARLAFGDPQSNAYETLIVVFLRGACDGLHMVPPVGGATNDRAYYELARPSLQIPVSGNAAALPLANSAGRFGLHPRATGLHGLYQSNKLAIVVGTGMPAPVTRSHFDAQQTMEYGTPGSTSAGSGWLTRHLNSAGLPPAVVMPAISAGSLTANSLIASTDSITMGSGSDFRIDTSAWNWNARDHYSPPPAGLNGLVERLPELWNGNNSLEAAGRQTLDALAVVRPMNFGAYNAANGAVYPNSNFGKQLKMIAQLVKADVGLRVGAIDFGGWDTHNGQGVPTSTYDPYGNNVQAMSDALTAFYTDLNSAGAANFSNRTSIVVMSEFGRRLRANGSGGTDHGYGNFMFALGGSVNGGQVYGGDTYAGLADEALFEGEDVQVTTDFRRVLSEALIRRAGNNHLGQIFPGYSGYAPMGIFAGIDLAPDYTPLPGTADSMFKSGFDVA
ncbi:MAG: DUF1501 domain-containing protein [Dokdonella sp.]